MNADWFLTISWLVLFAAAASEIAGQLMLKRGLDALPPHPGAVAFLQAMLANRTILAGLVLLTLWMAGYLFALQTLQVSQAFPAQSINAFLLVVASRFLLGETVSWRRWLGAGSIAVGVYLVVG